jgi:hypothetical protein
MVALCAAICVVVVGCGSGGDDTGGSAAASSATAPASKAEQPSGKAEKLTGDATDAAASELCSSLQPAAEDASGTKLVAQETLYDVSREVGTLLVCGYALPGESELTLEISRSWDNPQHTLHAIDGGFDPSKCVFTLGLGEFSCVTEEPNEPVLAAWTEGESDALIQLVSVNLSRAEYLALMKAAIGVEKSSAEADESGVDGPDPSGESAAPATQVQDRLKAAGYSVEVESAAPKTLGVYSVSFEGGPTEGGYSITAYVYETAKDAAAELEAFEAAFGAASPGAIEVSVVETRLYLAAAGPGGAVPAGALDKFIKVAEGH